MGKPIAKVEEPAAPYRLAAAAAAADAAGDAVSSEQAVYATASGMLGGRKFWRRRLASRRDVHAALVGGVPYGALLSLVGDLRGIGENDVAQVLGISTRTLRRGSDKPDQPMPPDLASKAWLLAETLAKASTVFGGREEAERWMSRPAMGLDGHRPIDLLRTMQGAGMVSDFLGRLEYGVYT